MNKTYYLTVALVAVVLIAGTIPSLSASEVNVTVDSRPNSAYPIVLLNLAVINGCSPSYQQQTVVMTPQQLTTAYSLLTAPDVAQTEKSCEDAVTTCTTDNLIAQYDGEPPVCDPNQVANQFAGTYTVNVTVVGYILNEHFSLNNRFPAKITNVRAKVGGRWVYVAFQGMACVPRCTFNVILNFTTSNPNAPTYVTFFVDTTIPIGWGIPPVWFAIVWFPKTCQASVSIGA